MGIDPPGFHLIDANTHYNCETCTHFSHSHDGFCLKYENHLENSNAICEDYFQKGKKLCPFCSNTIGEYVNECPFCASVFNADLAQSAEDNIHADQSSLAQAGEQHFTDTFMIKMDYWKHSLLDLSKRNNQLNFKPESKRNIEIFHPTLTHLFNEMVILHNSKKFQPILKRKISMMKKNLIELNNK